MSTTFNAIIKIRGINPFVLVSVRRANAIKPGWRKPLPVLVRLNGKPAKAWRINMMPVGNGSFYLYLHGDIRKVSGTAVGDRVQVEVEFDAAYRSGPQQPMPAWFRQALAANPLAKNNWESLIPSRKKEILRYFSRLKSPEARARNLARALQALSGEPGRFMARSGRTAQTPGVALQRFSIRFERLLNILLVQSHHRAWGIYEACYAVIPRARLSRLGSGLNIVRNRSL